MQNKANLQKVKFNVTKVLTKNYVQMDTWSIRKTKPIQSQLKPIQSQLKPIKANSKPIKAKTNPIKANKMPKQTQFKANQTQNETNLSCRSLWRSRNEPNSNPKKPNACPPSMWWVRPKKCCWQLLTGFGGRFLLTKQAFFYSIECLQTNTYKGLLFKLYGKNRGLRRLDGFFDLGCWINYWRSGSAKTLFVYYHRLDALLSYTKKSFLEKVRCLAKEPLQQF
jgi:hypothetical protein